MRILTLDFEVFLHDWLIVLKDHKTKEYTVIWNDNDALKEFLKQDDICVGFNIKHYDQFIAKAVFADFSPEEIKDVNDFIIKKHHEGWEYLPLKDFYFRPNIVDVMDDMQKGQSLKSIEGHLYMNIKETDVDFDIKRPLTDEEKRLTEFYCKSDVDATEKIFDLRKDYFNNKIAIGKLAGLDPVKAMGMTNAKLTAAMLKAKKQIHNDEREYKYRDDLKKEYIPQEVFDYFNRMYDKNISDEELFKGDKLTFNIGKCVVVIGFGGIHGAIPNYMWKKSNDGRIMMNDDVSSYYPHLMTICGYTSRNIPNAEIFSEVLDTRMKAKASGDKATANALKLVVNTTYGAMLNQYNDLYDPLMGRSVCISGQLYLLELGEHLYKDIPDLEIVQLNTDGIMTELDAKYYEKAIEIINEWQQRTGFELEEDRIVHIAQKDVNNYVEVQENGSSKAKGGYLVKGIAKAGAFKVNNDAVIVAKAINDYFVKGISVEDTVNNCNDIKQFQIISKAGAKYKESYWIVDGKKQSVQKVNRVYATANPRYGKLYKTKIEDDSDAKIASLPEHCIIDNDNKLNISDVDKTFYIELAKKRVNDFKGIKPEKKKGRKKMATATKAVPKNVYQKLIEARQKFLKSYIKQSGKNMQLEFKYFELSDIVPTLTDIFAEIGLVALDNFTNDVATLTIVNTENPEESITFTAPFNQIQPIISNQGKQVTNDMQALGSSITYMRRYLYLISMDICVNDDIEPVIDKTTNKEQPERKAPPTPEEREEVKDELTAPAENATDLQLKALKKVVAKYLKAFPDKENEVSKLAIDTKGFTVVSKSDCEKIINGLSDKLKEKENAK